MLGLGSVETLYQQKSETIQCLSYMLSKYLNVFFFEDIHGEPYYIDFMGVYLVYRRLQMLHVWHVYPAMLAKSSIQQSLSYLETKVSLIKDIACVGRKAATEKATYPQGSW